MLHILMVHMNMFVTSITLNTDQISQTVLVAK